LSTTEKQLAADNFSKNQKPLLTFSANQNISRIPRARRRGASRSSRNVGHGMRWTLRRQAALLPGETPAAYGEVVWSWRRDRGVYPRRPVLAWQR